MVDKIRCMVGDEERVVDMDILCDYAKGEISEIFRQYLRPDMPPDAGGFTVPDDTKVQ